MRNAKPWSGLWVAAGDGRDQRGRVWARNDEERLLCARKTPPVLKNIPREVF